MTLPFDDFWRWVRTAPLPVVITIVLGLAAWVYAIDSDQRAEKVKAEGVREQVTIIGRKMDTVVEGVADLRAEQRQLRRELRFATPHGNKLKEKQ